MSVLELVAGGGVEVADEAASSDLLDDRLAGCWSVVVLDLEGLVHVLVGRFVSVVLNIRDARSTCSRAKARSCSVEVVGNHVGVGPLDHDSVARSDLLGRVALVASVVRGVSSEGKRVVRVLRALLVDDLVGTPVLQLLLVGRFDGVGHALLRNI